ncbi:SDR family oxidoreductase [Brucella tritici]|uniref:SDR family oxidoreductase n=1 Tax=Brucella tritici TaxID=94626 RepID=A0A6N6QJP4_9HYPH|nr:SDR family oxidoreductase [Brucella tritici]KAB2663519.1 SDR family oxidoreductase [Brucella tritici]KAB2678208.1 SDR family oxidoreductase [Brucella tritici]NKW10042.1 SDR family oxidoreductase [Brucella tritici]
MDLGLKGRKAIVCASSKGLGRACAEALAEAGCDLILNGRNEEILAETAKTIRQTFGVKVDAVAADVSTAGGQEKLLSACPAPDILVNNNGGPAFKDFRLLDRDAILQGVTQNMVTPIELIKAVIDGMVERRFGRIVNITSTSVYAPIPGLDLSSGARAGLTAFLAGVARTVAASNVTINNILPGAFDTDRLRSGFAFSAQKNGTTPGAEAAKRASAIPAGRIGQPKEFGQACAFLCSEHSGFITGQNLVIDGGAYQSAF